MLFGLEDLRVLQVADPVPGPGEVLVRVETATTCGTDVKTWRRGHPLLGPYPAVFGHETCGVREDTGERVLVGDSVACGACRSCLAGRPQICREPRWIFGGFAERIAAPEAALHAVPDGLDPAAAAMAEPLRRPTRCPRPDKQAAPDVACSGRPDGLDARRAAVAEGRRYARRPPRRRRAQAEETGA